MLPLGLFPPVREILENKFTIIIYIIYDFFPYQKCKKSEVVIPEGAGGTEGLF